MNIDLIIGLNENDVEFDAFLDRIGVAEAFNREDGEFDDLMEILDDKDLTLFVSEGTIFVGISAGEYQSDYVRESSAEEILRVTKAFKAEFGFNPVVYAVSSR